MIEVQIFKKLVIGVVGAMVIGTGANFAAMAASPDVAPAQIVDVKGPCDEAEHASDDRCTGVQELEDRRADEAEREDLRGPCDEAEHANDDRCTGIDDREDRRGDDEADDRFEDRSGPSENSGPSGNSGPSENSGPGRGDDDRGGNDDRGGDSGHGSDD